jgi:HSP20 family molecular chaperone IbpA
MFFLRRLSVGGRTSSRLTEGKAIANSIIGVPASVITLCETDTEYTLNAEMPAGVDRSAIRVQIGHNDNLIIKESI